MAIVYHMLRKCPWRTATSLLPSPLAPQFLNPLPSCTFPPLARPNPPAPARLRAGYIGKLTARLAASGLTYHDAIAETGVYEQALGRLPASMQEERSVRAVPAPRPPARVRRVCPLLRVAPRATSLRAPPPPLPPHLLLSPSSPLSPPPAPPRSAASSAPLTSRSSTWTSPSTCRRTPFASTRRCSGSLARRSSRWTSASPWPRSGGCPTTWAGKRGTRTTCVWGRRARARLRATAPEFPSPPL